MSTPPEEMRFEPLTPERRRAITRQHLIDAAAIVFARDGFHGASLDDVAQTAGFTKGAVYSNFKSKEDLFLAVLDDRIERQFVIITDALDTETHTREEQLPRIAAAIHTQMWDDSWSMLFLEFVLYASRNPDVRSKLIAFQRKSRDVIEALIKAEYEAAGPPPKYPIETLAIISMAIFNGLGVEHLIDPSTVTDETLETLLSFMYDAMGSDDDLPSTRLAPPRLPTPPSPPTPPRLPTPPTPPAPPWRR